MAPNTPIAALTPPDSPEAGGRTPRGTFAPGNPWARTAALRHGLFSPEAPAAVAAREAAAAFLQQCIADEGGLSELSARQLALLEDRAAVYRLQRQLGHAIDHLGMFDSKGRLRVLWMNKLESLIATGLRIDALLGAERKSRRTGAPVSTETWPTSAATSSEE